MTTDKPFSHMDYLDSILLKGKVFEMRPNESITLEAQGALLTVRHQDIKEIRDISDSEKELLVSSSAKIIYQVLINPGEAEGILSHDMTVEISANVPDGSPEPLQALMKLQEFPPTECSRCITECSRCAPIVTVCTHCQKLSLTSERTQGYRRRLS